MSVMLRCSCGYELTIPDEAASGLVNCPLCHGKVDPKTSVIHPSLDDLEPDLLLAPDGAPSASAPQSPSAPRPVEASTPKKSSDDFLAMMQEELSSTSTEDDDFSFFAEEPAKVATTNEPGALDSSQLAAPTTGINPLAEDDEGYSIVESDLSTKNLDDPAWLTPSDLSSDLDELESAEGNTATPAITPAAKTETKSTLRDAAPAVHQPLADLLDDEILVAPDEKPLQPETPPNCPECNADLKPGSVLCVACGYNIRLGKKVDSAAPSQRVKDKAAKVKAKKQKALSSSAPGESKLKDPRVMILAGGGVLVLLLLVGGYLIFSGDSPPPKVATVPTPTSATNNSGGGASVTPGIAPGLPSGAPAPAAVPVDATKPTLMLSPTGVSGRVSSLALSDDGKLLVAGSESGGVNIWDLEKGGVKPTINVGVPSPVNVAFHPDGKQLLTGFFGGAKFWELESGAAGRLFRSPVDGLWAARLSADGASLLTSGPTGVLSITDLKGGGRVKVAKVDLPPSAYPAVDFTPDGKTAIFGADDGLLVVWDIAAGQPLKQLEGHTTRIAAVAISDDGKWALSSAGGPEYRTVGKERLLMASRPSDFTVRLWDVSTGKEAFRWYTLPSQSATCVAFSDDGKLALVVAGDVQVIDVVAKQLVTTIASTPPGAPAAPPGPGAPTPPNEPFRMAIFSHDGKRVITGTQSSAVHVWELPLQPAPKPLQGIVDPPDIALFKPAAWTPIRPLLLTPSSAPDDKETFERLQLTSKSSQTTATKSPTVKALQKALATQPRTADTLLKMAKACQKKELLLEAEECLRAALMADPTNKTAKTLYEDLKLKGATGAGPVSIRRAWVQDVTNLEDAGLRPDPPKNTFVVSIPIEIAVVDKATTLTASTLTGKAGDKDASFIGIHFRPTGEIQGARKAGPNGPAPAAGQIQIWEGMQVKFDKSGKKTITLVNQRIPQSEQPRGKQPASGTPKIKLVPDSSKVKEDYKGPYEALFAVPEGETLSEIQWEETTPIRVLAEEPKSLDKLVLDAKADKPQRLAAIEAIGVSPTLTAAQTLERIIAAGDDDLFEPARAAMRRVRRQANLIAPEYLPVPAEKEAHLAAIVFGKIDGQNIPQPTFSQFTPPAPSAPQIVVSNSYNFCKTLWNLAGPGKYLARVAIFGPAPDFAKQSALEFEFTATNPNLYFVQLRTDRDVRPDPLLIELWREDKLMERRILSSQPWVASALAARLPLEPPIKPQDEGEEETSPKRESEGFPLGLPSAFSTGSNAPLTQIFPGAPVSVEAVPVFGTKAHLMLPVERAALAEMLARVPSADQNKIPAAVVEMERLEMGDAEMTKQAIEALRTSLGDAATPLFIRLAQVSSPPTALAAIDALHTAGEKSAEACRTLIDLQKGPVDIQKSAEEAVRDLMTQGIIAQESDNWRYHDQTHFPVQPKEPAPESAAPPSE